MDGVGLYPLDCPWCFEPIEIAVEEDSEAGEWVEDCPVCCHPIALTAVDDGQGGYRLDAERSH